MSGVLRIELRCSLLVRVAPLAAVGLVALMLSDRHQWQGVWPEASAAITAPLYYLGPALAGAAAWEVRRRCGERESRNGGEPWAGPLLAAYLLAGAGVVAVGAACAVVVNLSAFVPAGFLWPSYLIIALAVVSECLAAGVLLGRLGGPAWFAPVVAVLACFLRLITTQGTGVGTPESRLTRVFLSGHAWVELAPVGVTLAVVEAAIVVAAALALPNLLAALRARREHAAFPWPRRTRAAVTAGCAVCVLGTGLVLTGPPLMVERAIPEHPVCTTDTKLQLCVWPEDAARLPALATLAQRASAQAEVLGLELPDHVSAYGLEPGASNFTIESDSVWFAANDLAGLIVGSVVPVDCLPTDADPGVEDFYRAYGELQGLIELHLQGADTRPAGMGDTRDIDRAEIARVAKSDQATQNAWIQARLDTMRDIAAEQCR
ncbi:DUF7224 domain-containing protein [Actinomyces procaprae]|uniref:DUF7224 domain-containing protein n=1 Tax=Actinomyces procaprae TaxID=2560010 RepID=UPI0010A2A7F3|nr:hypothetical protein [Actinomyces procaprae]